MITLLKKEWREHRIAMVLLYLVGLSMLAVEWQQAKVAITPLVAWHGLVTRFGSLAAVFISNRLVVREYAAGTQLFLETLPISRVSVILVKWAFGCCALLLFMGAALGCILWGARQQVELDAAFIALLGARAAAYLLFVYSCAFVIALTLRLRFFIWIMLFIAAVALDQLMQLPIGDWAPFYLVKSSMVLERSSMPWRELLATLALAMAALAGVLALALLARGALVTALARRLSARTRTVLALLFGAATWVFMLLEKRVEPPPFEMSQAVSSASAPQVRIGWQQALGGVAARQVATRMSADLARMQQWLGLADLSRTSLVADAWGDAGRVSIVPSQPGHLIIHAALGPPRLALHDLEAALRAAHLVDQGPLYRWREDRQWLLAGFPRWWGARQDPAFRALLERRAQAAAQHLQLDAGGYANALLLGASTEEAVGECLSGALAWRAVQSLSDELGTARFRSLMRALLAAPLRDDVQGLVTVRSSAALLDAAGHSMGQVGAALARVLPYQAPGAPTPALQVTAVKLAGEMRELRYRISNRPPDADLALHYRALAPAQSVVDGASTSWAAARDHGVLPATFTGGARVLVYAQAYDASLGCSVRFGARREQLP